MDELARICRENPALERTISIGGLSPLDGNASLANAGIIYLMFKDWGERGKGEDLLHIYEDLSARLSRYQDARTMVLVPPPIQGLGLSGGFQMQVELTDGSEDYVRLQNAADAIVARANADPAIRMALTPLRAQVPQVTIRVEKTQAETLGVNVGDVYSTVQAYLGSSFVNQFMRFGHQYMVYAQADAPFRRETGSLGGLLRARERRRDGAARDPRPAREDPGAGRRHALQPVSVRDHQRRRERGLQLRPGDAGDGEDRRRDASRRNDLRVDGDVVPGEARRQLDVLHLRPRDPARLLRPRRPVRELDHAGGGHPRGASRAAGHGRRPPRPRRGEQPLRADRAGAADRAVGQERDPHRRDGARGQGGGREPRRRRPSTRRRRAFARSS